MSIVASIVALLIAFGDAVGRQAREPELPLGCDQFGYLRQARLFQERGWFGGLNTELQSSQTDYLIKQAFALGGSPAAWAHGVAPHCHHYEERTGRIILQYPPGVGWLFSLFPEGVQARWTFALSAFVVLALLIPPAAAVRRPFGPLAAVVLGLIAFRAMRYFAIEYSIAPSLAAVLVLGLLTVLAATSAGPRRIVYFGLLGLGFGLATVLRLPNVFCAAGPGLVLAAAFMSRPGRVSFLAPTAFGVCLLLGTVPILIANAINAGSPLHTTYGAPDASPPHLTWQALHEGLRFYLYERGSPAFFVWAGAAGLAALAFVARRVPAQGLQSACAMAAIAVAVNLIYFVTHRPLIHYYMVPVGFYALSVACFGFISLATRADAPARGLSRAWKAALQATAALVVIAIAIVTSIRRPAVDPNWGLRATIASEAIVWSDLRSGAFNYTLRHQAAVLPFIAGAELQDRFVKKVAADGIPQYLVADSADMAKIAVRLLGFARLVPVGDAFGNPVYRIEVREP